MSIGISYFPSDKITLFLDRGPEREATYPRSHIEPVAKQDP